MKRPPNILLVFADQWTFWALGCNGDRQVRTPHLDRFATEGVNCHHAVSGTPVCAPARGSLLTGLRPDAHGLFINDVPLDPGLPSLGKHFSDAGYETAWVGKWHVDGHGRYSYIPPERRHGFATFKALECTHDYNSSRYYDGDDAEQKRWPGYDTFAQTDAMIDWLKQCKTERPFFGVLSWGPPHNPYHTAPEAYKAHYQPETLALRPNVPAEFTERSQRELAGYYAHCEALDASFGQLMSALDALGRRDDTIVIFTSDHGDMLGSHGLNEKQGPWDESLRIPMLLRGPGLPVGAQNDTLLEFIDLWPTLAGLAGLPVHAAIHGRDLSAALREGKAPLDNAAFYGSYACHGTWVQQSDRIDALYWAREARGLRTPSHLYVEDLKGPWLLYDMKEDPWQMHNLADSTAHADLRADLAERLRVRRESYGDAFLHGDDYVQQRGYQVDKRGNVPIRDWAG